MISATDLAMMRDALAPLRTTPCDILRKASVSDGMGGQADTWSTSASAFCRITPATKQGQESIDEGRLELLNRWAIYLPAGTDVGVKDRISANGAIYEVTDILAPRTIEIQRIVLCELVQ